MEKYIIITSLITFVLGVGVGVVYGYIQNVRLKDTLRDKTIITNTLRDYITTTEQDTK